MFRILTNTILTCLSKKREGRGGNSAFWFKIAQKLPKSASFPKVARNCFLTKKVLKILKVAKKLPSRIWKGLKLTAGWAWLRVFKKSVAVVISGLTVRVSSTCLR